MDIGKVMNSIAASIEKNWSNFTGKNTAGCYGSMNMYIKSAVLVVVMLSLTGLFVYEHNAIATREKALQKELDIKLENIRTANAFLEEHPKYDSYIKQLSAKNLALGKIIPDDATGDESLLGELQGMADAAGVELRGAVPGESVNEGESGYVPITLEVSCNYFTLMNFMERLDAVEEIKPRRLVSVKNSSLACKDGKLVGKLTIQAYFQKNV